MSDHPSEIAYEAGLRYFENTSDFVRARNRAKDFEDSDAFMDGWQCARESHHLTIENISESLS